MSTTTMETAFYGYAYMTATAVDPDDTVRDGWVDPRFSMTELFDSRNDVRPVAAWSRLDGDGSRTVVEDLQQWARETVDEWLGSWHGEDGTYYGEDESMDPNTGTVWTYALHLTASEHMSRYPNVQQWTVALEGGE